MEIVTQLGTSAKNESQTAPKTRECDEDIGEKEIACINLDKLMEDIYNLLKLIEEGKAPQYRKEREWPQDLKKLNEILSLGKSSGKLKNKVRQVLKGLGHTSLATTALLVVANTLEMYSDKKECLKLLKEMCYVGSLVKDFKEISPKGFHNVIQDATSLIVEGAITCSTQIGSSPWVQFFSTSNSKTELSEITEKLNRMYMKMNVQISLRVLTATEHEKSPLWKRHPKHAESQTALKTRECDEDIGEKEIACINDDNLMEDISNRLKQIEEEKAPQDPKIRDWPSPLQNLKDILSPETTLDKLNEIISKEKSSKSLVARKLGKLKKLSNVHSGEKFVFALKVITSGPVREVLNGLGVPSLAIAGLFVVSESLAMYAQVCRNEKKCLELLKEMFYVAILVKDFKESPKGFHNVIQDATSLIVEGAITCYTQIGSSPLVKFFSESDFKTELSEITEKLHRMYMKLNVQINVQISVRVLTATEPEKSPSWKRHPKHAAYGRCNSWPPYPHYCLKSSSLAKDSSS